MGFADAPNGQWRVMMPLGIDFTDNISEVISDCDPHLIILINDDSEWEFRQGRSLPALIPMELGFDIGDNFESFDINIPRKIASLLSRVRMRGWLQTSGDPLDFELRDAHAMSSSVLCRTAKHAAAESRHCFLISFHDCSDYGATSLIATLLRNLPIDDTSHGPNRPTPTKAPEPPSFALDGAIEVHGFIAHYEMRSLRMLDHILWQSPPEPAGWQVILGDNASGKTSLLRAIALCLLDRSERDALRQSWDTWLRRGSADGSVCVDLTETDAPTASLKFALQRVRPAKDTTESSVVDIHSSERSRYADFLAAYGPFRRFTGGDAEWVKSFKTHPRLQSVLTLFDERAALSDALEWLKDLWVRARTQQPTPPEAAFLAELLSFINETGFLPEGVTIEEPDADGVWCRDGNGLRVPAIELSDGYRSVLSLALDLLRRLSAEHGYDKVFATSPTRHVALGGIVLIDEVDAHLHPRWQQRIGFWFKEHFPRMQFIVATHSPIVCQAADSVMLLPTPGDDAAPRMATKEELDRLRYGDLLDAFSTDFFGERVTRSQAGREKLDRLAELNDEMIARELSPEEHAEQRQLRLELGTTGAVASTEAAE